MTARFKDESYRLPNFGVDGAIPQEFWSRIGDYIPDIRAPALPWWLEPWMPSAPASHQPSGPRLPLRPLRPNSRVAPSAQGSGVEHVSDVVRLLYELLENSVEKTGDASMVSSESRTDLADEKNIAEHPLLGLVSGTPMQYSPVSIFDASPIERVSQQSGREARRESAHRCSCQGSH
jgi:hypothetical protein